MELMTPQTQPSEDARFIAQLAGEIVELQREAKGIERRLAEKKDLLREFVPLAEGQERLDLVAGGYRVTRSKVMSSRLDTSALKENDPDTYAAYSVISTSERLVVEVDRR